MLVIYSFVIYLSSDVTNQWYWDYSISSQCSIQFQSRQEVSHRWFSPLDADIQILDLATTRLAWSLMRDEKENSFSDFRVCGTLISVVWLLLWMRQTNGRLDTESEDQSEAGRDRAHWQPPRVTVSHSVNLRVLGPVSGTLRTRTDEAGLIVPVICQKVGGNVFMVVSNFYLFAKYFLETHIFVSISFQTRGFHLFYNIMRPGARRHSIAVGLSSSSGSGPGGW